MTHPALELHLSVEEAVRLEAALAAYDRLIAGVPPDRDELDAAPLITGWRRVTVPSVEPALLGAVTGHPLVEGPRIVTSRLIALDPTAGWARTVSRLYRLAPPVR